MVKNAQAEMKEAKAYLDPYFDGRNVGIVDIGWYGTMQQVLKKLYGSNAKINGFYVGLLKRDGYSAANMHGYIFDYLQKNEFNDKLIYGFNGLIESFFSANHGSTKRYKNKIPILENWESDNWPIISRVHDGALQFCKDIHDEIKDGYYPLDKEFAFSD